MIKILLLTAFVMLNAGGEKFLQEIALYQKDSYFKEKVYAEHDHKSFAQLKEANKVIDPNNYDLHLLNAAIFYATNKIREQKHLPLLKFSSQLRDAAVVHSQQMVAKKFFDHFGKTPALRSPDNRIALFGIKDPQALGENIDYNHILLPSNTTYLQLGDALVDEWMQI